MQTTRPVVLIIEDDESIAELLHFALEGEGYGVERAADGTTGLARIQAGGLDLVLLEVHPSRPLVDPAIDLALSVSRTVYDSLYLALALALDCQFVTADERFFGALQSTSFGRQVLLVQNI